MDTNVKGEFVYRLRNKNTGRYFRSRGGKTTFLRKCDAISSFNYQSYAVRFNTQDQWELKTFKLVEVEWKMVEV